MEPGQEKINRAIRDCLEFCYQSEHIVPQLAEFLSTLKAADGWQKSEVRQVELGVLRVLHGIMDASAHSSDATDIPESDGGPSDSESPRVNGT